ncbi:MAG TPA: hypothetical protein VFK47_17450 [Ktedonobacteraceae bacterium]|nr:hypothetical protein [Ktedonobacteraceae bacterium]
MSRVFILQPCNSPGEAGTIGAPPAIVNAVVDALTPFGIRHLDMPLKPENVWQAIQRARTGK